MSNTVFLDYLGRQIRVGDVLANGHRTNNTGHIGLGVVTGFKDDKILVKKFQRGDWSPSCKYWWSSDSGKSWRIMNGYWIYGERCFITGLTEDALKALITQESEEKQ